MTNTDIRRNAREIFFRSLYERQARLESNPMDSTPAITMATALEIAEAAASIINT